MGNDRFTLDSHFRGNDTRHRCFAAQLIAESEPRNKELMIRLVMNRLAEGST